MVAEVAADSAKSGEAADKEVRSEAFKILARYIGGTVHVLFVAAFDDAVSCTHDTTSAACVALP